MGLVPVLQWDEVHHNRTAFSYRKRKKEKHERLFSVEGVAFALLLTLPTDCLVHQRVCQGAVTCVTITLTPIGSLHLLPPGSTGNKQNLIGRVLTMTDRKCN